MTQMERRDFLTFLGAGSYAMLQSYQSIASSTKPSKVAKTSSAKDKVPFTPIQASSKDEFQVAPEYKYDILCKWNDPLGSSGVKGPESFGYNNDFTAFIPINAREGKKSSSEGLLFVNHETVTPLFVTGYKGEGPRNAADIQKEKLNLGASVLHIKQDLKTKKWSLVKDSKYTRRYTALYPEIAMSGPAKDDLVSGTGTYGNCSGGVTPWHTVLTCEENYDEVNRSENGLNWQSVPEEAVDEKKYGWVVEIDPFNEVTPKKHTALGRFAHENAAVRISKDKKLVIYMGDDKADQCLYKFVSSGRYSTKMSRQESSTLLESGTLFVADLQNKKWLPLDLQKNPKLQEAGFKSQSEVLIDTRRASAAAGGSPLDRPEDCEIDPKDGSVYVAFTNNSNKKNHHGHILHLREKNNEAEALDFDFDIILAGGELSGISCPDNMVFDPEGRLWVSCDISSAKLSKEPYQAFANNGFYLVHLTGPERGKAIQFASAPVEAELTGPSFTPDGKTLFLSVQHPGEMSKDISKPTSTWPNSDGSTPAPAVVVIQRR